MTNKQTPEEVQAPTNRENGIGVWKFDLHGIRDWIAATSEAEAVGYYETTTGIPPGKYSGPEEVPDLDACQFAAPDNVIGQTADGKPVFGKVSARQCIRDNLHFPMTIAGSEW